MQREALQDAADAPPEDDGEVSKDLLREAEQAQRDAGVPLQRAVPRRHRLGDVRQDRDLQQQQG